MTSSTKRRDHHYSVEQIRDYNKSKRDMRRKWLEAEHKRNPRCHYCKVKTEIKPAWKCGCDTQFIGSFVATVDHAEPIALGGDDYYPNYRLCCFTCNNLKADMNEKEYIAMLVAEGIR